MRSLCVKNIVKSKSKKLKLKPTISQTQREKWDIVAQDIKFNLEINEPEFVNIVPTETSILDYGCGYGRTYKKLKTKGFYNIVGVDSSSEMVNRSKQENPSFPISFNRDIETNFPNEHFGAIILCAVLTCVPEQQVKIKIISEVSRLLSKNGILHVAEFCSQEGKIFDSKFGVKMNHQNPNVFREMIGEFFNELKFEVIQVKTMSNQKAQAISYFGQKQ